MSLQELTLVPPARHTSAADQHDADTHATVAEAEPIPGKAMDVPREEAEASPNCQLTSLLTAPEPVEVGHMERSEAADEVVYKTSRRRFLVVLVVMVYAFINQFQYVGFATIVREAEEKFQISALEVNILSLMVPVVYCIGVIPACWLYNTVGLVKGQTIGAIANAVGSVLKMITARYPEYPVAIVAQVFVAIGQILYLSIPPLVAARWFPVSERTVATAVCSLTGFMGMAFGMFLPPRIVYLPDHAGNKEWLVLMGFQLAISVVVVVLYIALVPESPKYPPSATSAEEKRDPHIWETLRRPFRNANMMVLTIFFGVPVGTLTAVAAVLTQIVEPFGVTEKNAGILAFAGILGGAANCLIVGGIVGKLRRYKLPLLLLTGAVTALLIPVVVLMRTMATGDDFTIVAYVFIPVIVFLVLPLVPVTMEFSVELTYPDPETVSSTVVLLSMCFFSFVGMVVFTLVLGDAPGTNESFIVMVIVLALCAVSVVGLCFVKEDRQRYKQELARVQHSTAEDKEEASREPTSASQGACEGKEMFE